MRKIILVTESGSDLTEDTVQGRDIFLVPMHVSFGEESKEDGSFDPNEIVAYYNRTGKVPSTSGAITPDFEALFDRLHADFPDRSILYLAYSAQTTMSYECALAASEGRDYVAAVDTQHVAGSLAACVMKVAEILDANPEWELPKAIEAAKEVCENTRFHFLPGNLDFPRAGGRVSNATALIGNILKIHPCIDIVEGKLLAGKRYRGSMRKVVEELVEDCLQANRPDLGEAWLSYTVGYSEEEKDSTVKMLLEKGFQKVFPVPCQGVITCHSGPGSMGFAYFLQDFAAYL